MGAIYLYSGKKNEDGKGLLTRGGENGIEPLAISTG